MASAQAAPAERKLVAIRIVGGLVSWGLAILAYALAGSLLGQVDPVLPWAVERLLPLLWVTALWFLFMGTVAILSAVAASTRLAGTTSPGPVPPASKESSPASAGSQSAPGRRTLPALRLRLTERAAALILAGLVAVFLLAYIIMGVSRHLRFNSTGYDLAINTQAIWSTVHGRPFATSLEVDNYLADHFGPSLLLLWPLYAVFPTPLTLVTVQALGVGLAAVPLYRVARRRLASAALALVVAAVYLLYPATGYLLRFDFHLEFLAVLAFLAAFDAMDEGRWKLATLWLVLALGCKEDMGLTVAAFGLYALVVRRGAAWGTAWLLLGGATFAAASYWLIPLLRGETSDSLGRYTWLGNSPREMAEAVLTNPGQVWSHVAQPRQLLYAVQLLLPVGYLCLLAPLALLLAAPALALHLLSAAWPQATIYFQYTAAIIPGVFIATAQGLAHLRRGLGHGRFWQAVAVALLPLSLVVFFLNNPFRDLAPVPNAWARLDNEEAVKLALQSISPEASVVTTNHYAPHLANRRELYVLGVPSQRSAPPDPDVVLFNLGDLRFNGQDEYRAYLLGLDPMRYGLTFNQDGVVVAERDKGSRDGLLSFWDAAALSPRTVSDLTAMFLAGEAQAADASAPEPVQVRTYTMPQGGDRSGVLFVHPGASISFRTVLPPQPAALYFRAAMDPASWDWGGDGATFVVRIATEGAAETELYRQHIGNGAADRRWHNALVSLADYAGQEVTLTLATEPGPAGDYTGDWAGWGTPLIIRTAP